MSEPGELAQQLRALREAQGFSVRALADLVGVSKVTIWKWEKGSCKPSARLLTSLAKALDVPPMRLEAMTNDLARPGNREESLDQNGDLLEVIAKAKQLIADAAGANPGNVTITIEY